MVRFDVDEFIRRGAPCVDNSDLRGVQMTCCNAFAVEDRELLRIYFDPTDLARSVALYESGPCPCCGAQQWDFAVAADGPIAWGGFVATSGLPAPKPAADALEHFILVAQKPRMFGCSARFDAACSYIAGYDAALVHVPLHGFREWLIVRRGSYSNLPWEMLVRQHLYPDADLAAPPPEDQQPALLEELHSVLEQFAQSRRLTGVQPILEAYQHLYDKLKR